MKIVMALLYVFICMCSVLLFTPSVTSYGDDDIPTHDRYPLHAHCVEALNKQINLELLASLTYLNMGAHFGQNIVARKGFAHFFEHQSNEEKAHAQLLIDYINKRGGKVVAVDVVSPSKDTWTSGSAAIGDAVALEKDLNNKLHILHSTAEHVCKDPHLLNFLEGVFLEEQVSSINELNRIRTVLNNFDQNNKALGEYLVDQQLLGKDDKKKPYFGEL